jgi:hypothetical protein
MVEYIVLDELHKDDLPEPEEGDENDLLEHDGDDMLFAFNHIVGGQESESEVEDGEIWSDKRKKNQQKNF